MDPNQPSPSDDHVSGAAAKVGERMRGPAFRRRNERVSGVVFLGFAANLLADRR